MERDPLLELCEAEKATAEMFAEEEAFAEETFAEEKMFADKDTFPEATLAEEEDSGATALDEECMAERDEGGRPETEERRGSAMEDLADDLADDGARGSAA
ncbi:hypothetical protein HK105_207632 [Polyrhizophydium stewartii]|uniref:Uncharacterized protein n=1 Tax=Polyrhizophydium stewartii TaxID=2732419 RepID=A0ABR4MZZ4_9FUNG|nr:hypothetical protein HK105_002795 [Polyrhizophydium stewartii]